MVVIFRTIWLPDGWLETSTVPVYILTPELLYVPDSAIVTALKLLPLFLLIENTVSVLSVCVASSFPSNTSLTVVGAEVAVLAWDWNVDASTAFDACPESFNNSVFTKSKSTLLPSPAEVAII